MDEDFYNSHYLFYSYLVQNDKFSQLTPSPTGHSKYHTFKHEQDGIFPFHYGLILNLSFDIKDQYIVVWDTFNTGEFYCNEQIYSQINTVKPLLPLFYIENIYSSDSKMFDINNFSSSAENPALHSIGEKSVVYYRYITDKYNGWAFSWSTFFSTTLAHENNQNNVDQPQLQFDPETTTLTNLLNELTNDLAKTNNMISKAIKKTSLSSNAKKLLQEIQEQQKQENRPLTPICANYTSCGSMSVNIVSKEHAFANAPEGFSYCSHKDATKSFEGTVALCGWALKDHSSCPLYNPIFSVIDHKRALDQFGKVLYDFQICSSTLYNLDRVVTINNLVNNQVVNTITYHSDDSFDEAISHSRVILNDLISSWNDIVETQNDVPISQTQIKPEKKSYILSLV